jgi:hypothetical protein
VAKPKVAPMLAAIMGPPMRKPSDKTMMKDHAKRAMRRATEDWVDGRMSTKEHNAVHDRAKHVLSGKHPAKFKGKSGERRPADHATNGY